MPISSSSSPKSFIGLLSKQRFELIVNLSLWYLISAFYNIYNKKALNILKLPYFIATIQMLSGVFIFIPLWILKIREYPFATKKELISTVDELKNVALFNTLTHIAGVIALGSGAVSFTQVVKASEPAFTAFISAVFQNSFLSLKAYAALFTVIIGVAISSANELTFSWYCLFAGIIANIFASARGVFSKSAMCGDEKCNIVLSAENFYAIITSMSCILLIPLMFIMEGHSILRILTECSSVEAEGLYYSITSGLLFYLYNELSFKVLDKVHPVTHALANTFKRIVIILSSIYFFKNNLTLGGGIGSILAIFGVTLYSLVTTKKTEK
jgi:solute carrier family 35 protein E1